MLNGSQNRFAMSKLPINAVLAARIRAARNALGISQSEVGRRMGWAPEVASSKINRYENERHLPNFETAQELAEVLGVPLAALCTGDDRVAEVNGHLEKMSAAKLDAVLRLCREISGPQQYSEIQRRLGVVDAKDKQDE
ncbi:helix-turn-helix domain-containing protein [Luteimonas fraxinea]|uniref:helix-turn-helix domain-containing protein n=1 Tax=Luteimonas fraxinea TaxID=2901869 RepID=UPI001E28ABAB|nr:helix-turn-helix transcriptional regulator [Luteimonas fraxinea]UHH09643.1 helix-turn-helix domain-containing protein [Luteimonas fraxinea]